MTISAPKAWPYFGGRRFVFGAATVIVYIPRVAPKRWTRLIDRSAHAILMRVSGHCTSRPPSLKPVRPMKSGHRALSNPKSIDQLGSQVRSRPSGQPRRRLLVRPDVTKALRQRRIKTLGPCDCLRC